MKKAELIDFKNWLNKNHKGMYIKISDYLIEKYLKEKSNEWNTPIKKQVL